MKQILQQTFNKSIEREFDYQFSVPDNSLYLIEIVASAKSWSQNFSKLRSFFKADNLAVKIDEIVFIENPKKQQDLFTGAAAWNGNSLKGYPKTTIFALRLQSGNHVLRFSSTQTPILESVQIYQIENEKEISYVPVKNQIQDRDRYSLVNFIFFDLPINLLNITAKARQGKTFSFLKRDDSDLQIIVDGEIQRNDEPKSHKEWYWCGRTLKGKSKTFSKELHLTKGIHSIELKADRNPEIENVSFRLTLPESGEKTEFTVSDVRVYNYRGIQNDEDYNTLDSEIVVAVNKWNKYFSTQEYPPTTLLHPDLVKAMIYIESRMGYQKVSEGSYPAYPDVMQVGDPRNPAIHTINNDGWIDPVTGRVAQEYEWVKSIIEVLDYHGEANAGTTQESIVWGVRWLYHKAQGLTKDNARYWKTWNEAVRDYNGNNNIDYESMVYKVYQEGIDVRNKNNPIKLWSMVFLVLIMIASGSIFGIWLYNEQGRAWLTFESGKETDLQYTLTANILEGVRVKKKIVSKFYQGEDEHQKNYHAFTPESNPELYYKNVLENEEEEIIVSGKNSGGTSILYVLKKTKDGLVTIPSIDKSGSKNRAFRGNDIEFVDIDGDGTMEARELFYHLMQGKPYQVYRVWYLYNEASGIYVFYKEDQISKDHPDKETIFLW